MAMPRLRGGGTGEEGGGAGKSSGCRNPGKSFPGAPACPGRAVPCRALRGRAMQPFGVPVQITLQGRRRAGRTAVSAPGKKRSSAGSGAVPADVHTKLPCSAGEDRAMLLGFAMMGFSVIMFFLLGTTILRPFLLSPQREESSCTVLHTHMGEWLDHAFACGVDCRGQETYPCLQVLVNLTHSGQKAHLRYNEEAVQTSSKCFYTPKCHRDRNDLLTSALNIKEFFDHKNGTPFSCFYSPGSQSEDVILITKYDHVVIVHCLLWPSLTLLGGALIAGMVRLTQHLSLLCEVQRCSRRRASGWQSAPGRTAVTRTGQHGEEQKKRWRDLKMVTKHKACPSHTISAVED